MKRIFLWVAILVVCSLGFLAANYSKNFEAKEPDQLTKDPAVEGLESVIAVPVSIKASDVERLLRQQFPNNELFRQSGVNLGNGVSLQVILNKRGQPTVSAENDELVVRIPVHADIRVDWSYDKRIDLFFGSKSVKVSTHKDTNVQFTILAKIRPSINADYSINSGVDLSYSLDRGAQIKVGPIEINLVSKVREALDGHMAKLGPKVEGLLREQIKLRPYAEEAWAVLSTPVVLDSGRGIYAWAEPIEFGQLPFRTHNGSLEMGVGLKGAFYAAAQQKAPIISTAPLPDFTTEAMSSGFSLNIPLTAEYESMAKVLDDELVGEVLDFDGHTVEFLKFSVFGGKSGQLVVGARASFKSEGDYISTKGWVYLLGDPSYDEETQALSIENLEYDVHTRSVLVNTLTWAASPFVIQSIQSQLNYSLRDDLSKIKQQVNELDGRELSDGVVISALLSEVGVKGIYVGTKSITVNVFGEGEAEFEIDGQALEN